MHHNQHISELGPLFAALGIRHVVICPGSRNAPLIQLFTSMSAFRCHSIVDERSAGYVALGMARCLGEPVAVLTTSGTAVLNLSPAVAEAYYQGIPLVIVTADRPLEPISSFNNQWLDQEAPYYSFSRGFCQVSGIRHPEDIEKMLDEVAQLVHTAVGPLPGPVHLNVLLEEPLYEKLPQPEADLAAILSGAPGPEVPEPLPGTIDPGKKILVLAGMGTPDKRSAAALSALVRARQAVVVAENIANLPGEEFIAHPELTLAWTGPEERAGLVPDLILSLGGQVVSKQLRLFLQSLPGLEHRELPAGGASVLGSLTPDPEGPAPERGTAGISGNRFLLLWKRAEEKALDRARTKLGQLPFGNMAAVHRIISAIPGGAVLHLGNSTAIRYSQLVPLRRDLLYYSNRGTSGIDGCVSAAVGAASVSALLHMLIVGDLSFVYDSNALWNRDFPENLRIIVLNDGGGGIFRLLEGPDRMEFFEAFSVAGHPVSLELLSQAYGRAVRRATDFDTLGEGLEDLFRGKGMTSVLEVDTAGCENSRIFKDFFE
jgi:2-succinyl-5-enolpyruvyl-6-hydroxy-3-cyclohexene-1-carboxylate synthase